MSDFVTCPSCGARSGAEAVWCSMCFEPLRPAADSAAEPPDDDHEPAEASDQVFEDSVDVAAEPPAAAATPAPGMDDIQDIPTDEQAPASGETESSSDATTWQCGTCDTVNPISLDVCSVCGATIFQAMGADTEEVTMSQDQALVLALVPGLAHARLAEPILGFIIGILVLACLGFAFLFIQSGGVVWGLVVGVVGLLTWGVSVFDVNQRIAGAPPVLRPRVITILGGVVILIIMVAGFVAGASALRSS